MIGYLLYSNVSDGYSQQNLRVTAAAPNAGALSGTWIVDSSTGWPPDEQWKSVDFDLTPYQGKNFATMMQTNGKSMWYSVALNGAAHDIHFVSKQGSELYWQQDSPGRVSLNGTWAGSPATLRMHPQPPPLLLSRGFHWVQEIPYNR